MVKEEKKRIVEELRKMMEEYPVVGVVDIYKLPSRQLQEMRKKFGDEVKIKVSKKTLIRIAAEGCSREDVKKLMEYLPQQPAMIFSRLNPFRLYSLASTLKSKAPAKAGDIAPEDIVVKAGITDLMPGPVISELTKVGIPVGVQEGKVAIKKDVVVVKKGEVISAELANVLRKLGIEPIEIGLNIAAVCESGFIYTKDVLELVDEFKEMIPEAHSRAVSLSIAVCYPTKQTIKFLLAKAFNIANALNSKIGGVS